MSVLVPPGSISAAAQTGEEVGDAQEVTLPYGFSAPAGLSELPPLGGLAFFAPSVEAGFYDEVSTQDGSYSPAVSGDQLLYLSVNAYSFAPPFGQTPYHYAAPQLVVSFAGHAVSLPENGDGTVQGVAGSAYGDDGAYYPGQWVVALPKSVPVQLVATEAGFSQTLDLRSGQRVGVAPTVLYRSASGPLALDQRPNLAGSLVVTAGGNRVTFPVTLKEAVLNFFNLARPDGTAGVPPSEAYLFVEASFGVGTDGQGRQVWYIDPSVPSSVATLVVNGHSVAPVQSPSPPDPTDNSTLFDGVYGFVVPGAVTSASLTLGAGSSPSVYYFPSDNLDPTAEPVSAATPASFALGFPPPSRSPTSSAVTSAPSSSPSTQESTPAGLATRAAGPSRSQHSGGSSGWPAVGAGTGAVIVIVVIGGVFISRKTRLVEPRPVEPIEANPPGDVPPIVAGSSEQSAEGPDIEEAQQPVATLTVAGSGQPVVAEGLGAAGEADRVPRLRVLLLGRLEVQGTVGVIRRRLVLRALIVLALNVGRPISSDELRNSLAQSDDQEPAAPSLRSELSRLRAVLPPGLLPDREPGLGYGFSPGEVEVDWLVFCDLVSRAEHADGQDRLEMALRALDLVRGPVLVNQSWHGIDTKVWEMTARVEGFAAETARLRWRRDGRSLRPPRPVRDCSLSLARRVFCSCVSRRQAPGRARTPTSCAPVRARNWATTSRAERGPAGQASPATSLKGHRSVSPLTGMLSSSASGTVPSMTR